MKTHIRTILNTVRQYKSSIAKILIAGAGYPLIRELCLYKDYKDKSLSECYYDEEKSTPEMSMYKQHAHKIIRQAFSDMGVKGSVVFFEPENPRFGHGIRLLFKSSKYQHKITLPGDSFKKRIALSLNNFLGK